VNANEKVTNETSRSSQPQTVTRVFHTAGSDASHTRTTLEALAPVAVTDGTHGGGLWWISSITNGALAGRKPRRTGCLARRIFKAWTEARNELQVRFRGPKWGQ
jgi:hypothetical protein